jgi:List-Bact-rpt repeat protein
MRCKRELNVIALLIASITSFSAFAVAEPNNVYTITATANVNGSISPAGAISIVAGGSQDLTITPDPDYQILSVIVDGTNKGDVNKYTFSNVQANHTISAHFKRITYTITATAEANGAISPPGVNTVNPGGSMNISITPNAGYRVAHVLVDGVSAGAMTSYTFTNVRAGHTIKATFTENEWYIIDASVGANGSISPSGKGSVLGGTNWKFTITPAAGYRVADVAIDGVSNGALTSYTFYSVQAVHTIRASFTLDVYTITASVTNWDYSIPVNGSITLPGIITVNRGDSRTYTIAPDEGYVVYSVLVDDVQMGGINSYIFSGVTADHTIAAYVKPITYTITAKAGSGGSISPEGVTSIVKGGSQTYTITPKAGNHIAGLLIDAVSQGPITTWSFSNVTANHTIKAYFK